MSKGLSRSLIALFGFLLPFAAVAFVSWEINPGAWSNEGRFLAAVLALFFGAFLPAFPFDLPWERP